MGPRPQRPGFLRREKERLTLWLDKLADGDDDCA